MIYFTYDIQLLFRIILIVWLISRTFRAIKYGKPDFWRELLLWGLLLYVAVLLYNTFEPFAILLERQNQRANLVPLQGILKMIEYASIFDDEVTQRTPSVVCPSPLLPSSWMVSSRVSICTTQPRVLM